MKIRKTVVTIIVSSLLASILVGCSSDANSYNEFAKEMESIQEKKGIKTNKEVNKYASNRDSEPLYFNEMLNENDAESIGNATGSDVAAKLNQGINIPSEAISEALTDELLNEIEEKVTAQVKDDVIKEFEAEGAPLSDAQKQEIEKLISSSVTQSNPKGQSGSGSVTVNLDSKIKDEIASQVASAVKNGVSGNQTDISAFVTQSASSATKISELENQISQLRGSVDSLCASSGNNRSYTLTESDKDSIAGKIDKQSIINELASRIRIPDYSLTSSDKNAIANEVTRDIRDSVTSSVKNDIVGSIASYVDINSIASNVETTCQDNLTNWINSSIESGEIIKPKKGVDYFTESEIEGIKAEITQNVSYSVDDTVTRTIQQIVDAGGFISDDAINNISNNILTEVEIGIDSAISTSVNDAVSNTLGAIQEKTDKIDDLESQISAIQSEIPQDLSGNIDKIAQNSANITAIKEQIKDIEGTDITTFKNQTGQSISKLTQDLVTVNSSLEKLTSDVNNLPTNEKLTEIGNRITNVQSSLSEYATKEEVSSAISEDVSTLSSGLEQTNNGLLSLQGAVGECGMAGATVWGNIKALDELTKTLDETTQALKDELGTGSTSTDPSSSIKARIETTESLITAINDAIGEKKDAYEPEDVSIFAQIAKNEDALQSAKNSLDSSINLKADQTDLDNLKTVVGEKEAGSKFADASTVWNALESINNAVDSLGTSTSANINTALGTKSEDADGSEIEASNVWGALSELKTNINSAKSSTENLAKNSIASVEDISTISGDAVGDFIINKSDDSLNKWDGTKWVKTSISNEMKNEAEKIGAMNENIGDLEQLKTSDTTSIVDAINSLKDDALGYYNEHKSYAIGDVCIKKRGDSNALYCCKTATSGSPETAEPFDESKWIIVNAGKDAEGNDISEVYCKGTLEKTTKPSGEVQYVLKLSGGNDTTNN